MIMCWRPGRLRTVREFVTRAFAHIGVRIEWQGQGLDEVGVDRKSGKVLVKIDPALFRPKDVNYLLGDASKAKAVLDWMPKIYFDDLISEMINADRNEYYQQAGQRSGSAVIWAKQA